MAHLDNNFVWIDSVDDLDIIMKEASQIDCIGIDIESNSMYTYSHEICLLQLAIGDSVFLLDTMKIGLTWEVKEILLNPNITKVFQDMQYDLSLLQDQWNCFPKNLFDVSIADRLIRKSIENNSLDKMVTNYLNIDLPIKKSIQKSNWGIRPLSDQQIEYAGNDVKFLVALKEKQENILKADYRFACMKKYVLGLQPASMKLIFNIHSMWRIKGINTLNQSGLNRLRRLLVARDIYAKQVNRPLHWIIPNSLLIPLVEREWDTISEFLEVFSENRRLKTFHKKAVKFLFSALQDNSQDVFLERPEIGVPLKVWIKNKQKKKNYRPRTGKSKIIKNWQKICALNTHLLPEFLLDKSQISKWASMSIDDLEINVEFPGIIDTIRDLFLRDLINYMDSQFSELDDTILLKEFKIRNHLLDS
ncbi:MAG: hypothetical protein ACXAD7_03805 [Candidatus Kariarchaeaceae archaeon]|jgi:ribonuclease D